MGLQTLAYYFDRAEAVIVQSVLLDAGVLAVIGNEDMLRVQPYYTTAFGGYRIQVSDLDLSEPIAVLHEAVGNPLREGEALVTRGSLVDRASSLLWGWLAGGVSVPLREYVWRDSP